MFEAIRKDLINETKNLIGENVSVDYLEECNLNELLVIYRKNRPVNNEKVYLDPPF